MSELSRFVPIVAVARPSIALVDRGAHVESMLDAALEATFPASDPIAITAAANDTPSAGATAD